MKRVIFKNIVTNMIRRAQENYFKNRFNDAIDDTKKSWWLLNDLLINSSTKGKKGVGEMKVGDSRINNPVEAAGHFSSSSCSVSAEVGSIIPSSNNSVMFKRFNTYIRLRNI